MSSNIRSDHSHSFISNSRTIDDDQSVSLKSPSLDSAKRTVCLPQSDSGICLTPQGQDRVLSPGQSQVAEEVPFSQKSSVEIGPLNGSEYSDCTKSSSFAGNVQYSDRKSTPPDLSDHFQYPVQHGLSKNQTSDNFVYQTKYIVLQFLHKTTKEHHLLHLSQNSSSPASESEPPFGSQADQRRHHWQNSRSQSSPTTPYPRSRPTPLTKTKCSRSSPNLKDANFFSVISPVEKTEDIEVKLSTTKEIKSIRTPKFPRPGTASDISFNRSISDNTESSELGIYESDADDELETSCDSSLHGSTASLGFCSRLDKVHKNRLPTVHSETESLADGSSSNFEEVFDETEHLDVAVTLPVPGEKLNVEFQKVPSLVQNHQVSAYSVTSPTSFQIGDTSTSDLKGMVFNNTSIEDEVDSPPFHLKSNPESDSLEHGSHDQMRSNALSASHDDSTEGAQNATSSENGQRRQARVDRSHLRLNFNADHTEETALIDAVHFLQEEIEEEMSSFESEYEEVLQNLQSERSSQSSSNLSSPTSPVINEIASILVRIGDDFQQRHFEHINRATDWLLLQVYADQLTYEMFCQAALMVIHDTNLDEWRQVATILLYSRQVALVLVRNGRQTLQRIIEFTVRLLADTAADFIIRHGGWGAVTTLDLSSTPSSPDDAGPVHNPFVSSSVSQCNRSDSRNSAQLTTPNEAHIGSTHQTAVTESPESHSFLGPGGDADILDSGSSNVCLRRQTAQDHNDQEGSFITTLAVSVGVFAVCAAVAIGLARI